MKFFNLVAMNVAESNLSEDSAPVGVWGLYVEWKTFGFASVV